MNNRLLKIRYKDCLQLILWIGLLQGVISSYLGFGQISYVCDFLLIVLLIAKIFKEGFFKIKVRTNVEYFSILIFAVVVIIGWLFNPTPISMALWAIRNYGRFFLYFILCHIILDSEDVDKMESVFLKIFPVHIVLVIYQYVIERINQDLLNGIFGNRVGGNAGLMIYLSILMCIVLARYEYKKISLAGFILYLMLILVNAALAELKFLFIVAFILLAWYLLMSKRKGRGMLLTLVFIIIMYIATQVFYAVFPEYANFMNLDNILNQLSEQEVYASQYDVGRTAVFSKLTPIITRWAGKDAIWVGIGLGNADYSSSMSLLNSAFFKVYENIHYTWLSLGYLFVETGYLGTIAYTLFFVVLEVVAILRYQKKTSYENLLGTFFPLICMIMVVYNSVLRSNYAYIIFATLSWNKIKDKRAEKNMLEDE